MNNQTPEQLEARAQELTLQMVDNARKIEEIRARQLGLLAEVAQIDERLHMMVRAAHTEAKQ